MTAPQPFVRVTGDRLEVVWLAYRRGRARAVLLGVPHVASRVFYRALMDRRRKASEAGAVLHLEWPVDLSAEQAASLTPAERKSRAEMHSATDRCVHQLDWVYPDYVFVPSWRDHRVDRSPMDLLRPTSPEVMTGRAGQAARRLIRDWRACESDHARAVLAGDYLTQSIAAARQRLDDLDAAAVQAALQALRAGTDVVVAWSPARLSALGDQLTQDGCDLVNREWATVGILPSSGSVGRPHHPGHESPLPRH
jgi:hypothetical protein